MTAQNRIIDIKQVLLSTGTALYKKFSQDDWNHNGKCRLLIETSPGFTPEDWVKSLEDSYNGWSEHIELRFVHNILQRASLAPGAEIYVSTWLSNEYLKNATDLRWVHLTVGGVEFLEEIKIPSSIKITTVAGISSTSIAEHVIGLIIALDRRFDIAFSRQNRNLWNQSGIVEHIRGLKGRTLGIVGLGNNGQAIVSPARALGMNVIGLDKRLDLAVAGVDSIFPPERLIELLRLSDFVVLCVPLNKGTYKLIGLNELMILGPNSYLINVSRGQIVDEKALAKALKKGLIAGAALDVLSTEPPGLFHPLRNSPNLLITPHVAGNIYMFREEIRNDFVRQLMEYIQKRN